MATLPASGPFQTGSPANVIDRARQLCADARASGARARRLVRERRTQRVERRRWSSLLVRCVYCDRARTLDGEWVVYPEQLTWGRSVEVSHGACRDCLAEHFPQWPSLTDPLPGTVLPHR